MGRGYPVWDYLIVTASNDAQARAYRQQLDVRRRLGLLPGIGRVLVVPDPGGRRIGSGGSTVRCLADVVELELADRADDLVSSAAWEEILRQRRILIVHAGGDSRRLPAYGPCGKVFVPVPGESDSFIGTTLFDRQLSAYLALPESANERGEVIVTAGDVLLTFDPSTVRFTRRGVTGTGSYALPEAAAHHGVYCADAGGRVRLVLQKPSVERQHEAGAVDHYGRSILDIGILRLDAGSAVALMRVCGLSRREDGRLSWSGPVGQAIDTYGLDIYREVCCALGGEIDLGGYIRNVRAGRSNWADSLLAGLFEALHPIPLHAEIVPQCGFLHFGTTREALASGVELLRADRGVGPGRALVTINCDVLDCGSISGDEAWVEGCRVSAPLQLGGLNVVVGADVDAPFSLARGRCLDMIPGSTADGRAVWFVRCYGIDDTFKDADGCAATYCGMPFLDWLSIMQAREDDVWESTIPASDRSIWNAHLFAAVSSPSEFSDWLYMFDPVAADEQTRRRWLAAERYSLAEIACRADHDLFHERRRTIRSEEVRQSLRRLFLSESGFSVADLAEALQHTEDRAGWIADLLQEARWYHEAPGLAAFSFSRMMHSLADALLRLTNESGAAMTDAVPAFNESIDNATSIWLESVGLTVGDKTSIADWADRAKALALRHSRRAIVVSGSSDRRVPRNGLRSDEIVWGRAPARLDLCGGWSDTPPYTLERGGCVLNAAVNLNGQPPIHCYARVIAEPIIRISSIDQGSRLEIRELADLLDYRGVTSEFGLAKAALALSGFSPEFADWPDNTSLPSMLSRFGGGIELTTLAAIPKGSGLGTSSIVGAVILAVVNRMMGRDMSRKDLFHGVLCLEQILTTGGGWQDQIGGAVDGVKTVTTDPGMVPDPRIHYSLPDVLDPRINGGLTLLYYTGITRLAKNILQQVVGRYLDRDRAAITALRQIHELPLEMAEAMARRDVGHFGRLIDLAWQLNKRLDPDSSNAEIEALLARVQAHIHGAKLLGAGGGGFLLMVCRTVESAAAIRHLLGETPSNPRARFFDFDLNHDGLVVTVC